MGDSRVGAREAGAVAGRGGERGERRHFPRVASAQDVRVEGSEGTRRAERPQCRLKQKNSCLRLLQVRDDATYATFRFSVRCCYADAAPPPPLAMR